jgi:hypothetical protein
MKLPNRLRLDKDGTLSLDDGGDVQKYLKKYAKEIKVKKGELVPMTLMVRARAVQLDTVYQYAFVG